MSNIIIKDKSIRQTGTKQAENNYFVSDKPVDKQGNELPYEVALVVKCVAHYRKWMQPLKTIYLCPAYYVKFKDFVKRKATEEQADLKWELMTFDGVEINMMEENHFIHSAKGNDLFDYDFYPKTIN